MRCTSTRMRCTIVPDVSSFRTFGCLAYGHVPKEHRKHKVGRRGAGSVLLSSGDGMFKLCNLKYNTLTGTKHVFVE